MVASGTNQREIAEAVRIPRSAVSQQLGFGPVLESVHPEVLLKAVASVRGSLAAEPGYERLAVFGSVARGEARKNSDIDLIVDAPAGTSSFAFIRFKQLVERILGRDVDLITYAVWNRCWTMASAGTQFCRDRAQAHDSCAGE